jgi:hypothetical protein
MPSKDLLPLYLLLKRQKDMVGVCFIVSVMRCHDDVVCFLRDFLSWSLWGVSRF